MMLPDRGPLSAAYVVRGAAFGLGHGMSSSVDVHRRGAAVSRGTLRFAASSSGRGASRSLGAATEYAFDSLELPVTALAAAAGDVLVSVASDEVNGPLVVKRGDRVEVGFPFFDWEARCLEESYVDLSQPLYSRLPVSYGVVPFRVRAALLQGAATLRAYRTPAAADAAHAVFPESPTCGVVDRLRNVLMGGLSRGPAEPSEVGAPRTRGTLVLTHDVDELSARPGIETLRAVERRHGFTSAWGLLSEKYRLPDSCVESLLAEGCEIFSHGYLHDGRLPYLPRQEQLRRLRHFFTAYPMLQGKTRGFRCGQLARSRSLYSAVQQVFEYDMTPPSTERGGPYGARSGVSTVFPFWSASGLLHIPLTLPQDYFLAFVEHLSGPEIAARWIAAAEHVLALGGTAVHLVHPDNVLRSGRIAAAYDRFLGWARDEDLDVCLPGELAARLGPRPVATRTAR